MNAVKGIIWFIAGGLATAMMGLSGFFIPALLTVEDGRSATSPIETLSIIEEAEAKGAL